MGKGIEAALTELQEVTTRVHELQARLSNNAWRERPVVGKWSPIECIEHLNVTNRWYVEHLEAKTKNARPGTAPERMSFLGWIVWRSQRSRKKYSYAKTTARFVPPSELNPNSVLREFFELQERLRILILHIQSLPLSRIKMTSPFNEKITYDLYSAIRIVTVHEFRHLEQAERAITATA